MPIVHLDGLNISLDKFNEVANGKYNIGQLKLEYNDKISADIGLGDKMPEFTIDDFRQEEI